mmetsp:Transcript_53343/g.126108  ORF Transcript_53343/g.126108 Transcript_53343/m.126108 type:complete len:399 (-) Transcript_53343:199-1395(-)|eukprot:CAMPEP_0177703052 /NCGR_PEP_ID=MMETSP0484_2-20121128/7468_1 /TAXON_ID=354590 /ORGANISM="Rhodomonas lens, Strain RHODO" /LENGTH=398 /DNA_ID=CAMNT_0019214385 /DNA_START=75 /DNA_END=1271 /DNA_ORIENTATION=+
MEEDKVLAPSTVVAQMRGGEEQQFNSVTPAIYPATTYLREPDGSYPRGTIYIRDNNPTAKPAELALQELEGGGDALLFSSGMSAAMAVFQGLSPGDRVVIPHIMYWGLRNWVLQFGKDWGLQVTVLDMTVEAGEAALSEALKDGPKLVWLETPANPTWDITDLQRVASLAHASGALVVVDSTAATPVHMLPLALGADLVMHSATKYLNGHSDLLAGALVASKQMAGTERWQKIRQIRRNNGMMLGSMDAWLLQRGMRTLFLRVQRQSASALAIAAHVHQKHHPRILVLYPGLPSSPGHAIAQKQMRDGFGGMLSLRVIQGATAEGEKPGSEALHFAARLKVFKRATSLGGVESLVEHRKSIEGPSSPIPDDLLRISVGIEDVNDLIADLDQAAKGLRQ